MNLRGFDIAEQSLQSGLVMRLWQGCEATQLILISSALQSQGYRCFFGSTKCQRFAKPSVVPVLL